MSNEAQTSRRSFLKKTVYVAPAMIALGALSTSANAVVGDSGLVSGAVYDENGNLLGNTGAQKGTAIGDFFGSK